MGGGSILNCIFAFVGPKASVFQALLSELVLLQLLSRYSLPTYDYIYAYT